MIHLHGDTSGGVPRYLTLATEHMHAHAMVLFENIVTGYKMRLNRRDLAQMRVTFAKGLTQRGLPHRATPAKQKRRTQRMEKCPALARTLGEGTSRDAVMTTLRQAKAGDATPKAALANLRNNPASAKELPKALPQPSPVVDQKRLTSCIVSAGMLAKWWTHAN